MPLCLLIVERLTGMTAAVSRLMARRPDEGRVVRICLGYPARRRTKSASYWVGRVPAHAAATPNSFRRRAVRSRDRSGNRPRCCTPTETGNWTMPPCFWWSCVHKQQENRKHPDTAQTSARLERILYKVIFMAKLLPLAQCLLRCHLPVRWRYSKPLLSYYDGKISRTAVWPWVLTLTPKKLRVKLTYAKQLCQMS